VICAVTAVAFGLAPAIAATRIDIQGVSRETSNQTTLAGRFGRLRDVLVIAEVTLAFVLAAGAVAVIGEMQRLAQSDPGMDTRHVLTLHLTPRATADDYAQIEARVRALPGITAAGFTQLVPLQNWGWVGEFTIKGEPPPATGRRSSDLRYVTPGYFDALKIPILKGRNFTSGDTADAPRVVVVNDTLARRYFPNTDPVGRELDRGTIIGVIGDVRQAGLDVPVEPEVYYHIAQNLASTADAGMSLIVRATGDPAALAPSIRAAIADVKPGLAVFNIKTMDQVLADSLWELTLYRWLIGAFAALVLTLAAIGLHGVIAYSATVRMREFAVRLALGSEPAAVARLVVSRALRLAGAGLLLGLGLTTALARLAGAVSIVATPGAITYGVVSATLVAVAVLASAAPAFRVLRVNPAVALRHD
jgi:putative ABC transport system permease protein